MILAFFRKQSTFNNLRKDFFYFLFFLIFFYNLRKDVKFSNDLVTSLLKLGASPNIVHNGLMLFTGYANIFRWQSITVKHLPILGPGIK